MASKISTNLLSGKLRAPQQWIRMLSFEKSTENKGDGAKVPEVSTLLKSGSLPQSTYGGRHVVTMLDGNGIGPELCKHIREIFKVTHIPVDFEVIDDKDSDNNRNMLEEAFISLLRNRVGIKANLTNVLTKYEYMAPNVFLRSQLDLYVYYVHYKALSNVKSLFPDLDIMLLRQNTGGEYTQLEHESIDGYVESLKVVKKDDVERLARWAFDHALKHNRKKITVVHKNREMPLSDGLFMDTVEEVSAFYPQIELDDVHIDTCCRHLVSEPHQYDVLLTPNLYGTVVSNIICATLGGAGLFSGANMNERCAIFEPATRHTGEDLVGKNIANPTGMISASINMLKHLKEDFYADLLQEALIHTVCKNKIQTPDIGGTHTTLEVIDHIIDYMVENMEKRRFNL